LIKVPRLLFRSKKTSIGVRVLTVITGDEARAAQVQVKDRPRCFRADDGKQNMTAPAEAATRLKIVWVRFQNNPGRTDPDSVGVATSWRLPGIFAGTPSDCRR
jgi:hypothetical protein